jgi:4-hydroxybenzoate polyprenyltransferase
MSFRDYLELVRAPNVLTAPADVAMGMAAAGAHWEPRHALLFGASMLAYAGGMALNDACDAELDAVERPRRPIPSGRIRRGVAFKVAGVLLGGALALAAADGAHAALFALALVAAIVAYDTAARRTALGPTVMASCRALDAGLGLSAGALGLHALAPVAILFAYVMVITGVSRFETAAATTRAAREAAGSFLFVIAMAALALVQRGGATGLPLLALLALWLAGPLRAALSDPVPPRIIAVIKASVLGIVLLDAAFVTGAYGLPTGLAVALLFVPAYYLGRRFSGA